MARRPTRGSGAWWLFVPLIVVFLWSCTTEAISPIDEFDFVFEELDVDLEDPDIDTTSTIEVVDDTPEEDTTFIAKQTTFINAVDSSGATGETAEVVSEVAEAADEALDEETEDQLNTLAEEAESDPEAFTENLTEDLRDPNSAASQLIVSAEEQAKQEQVLEDLLSLLPPASKLGGDGLGSRRALPEIDARVSTDVMSLLSGNNALATCEDDALAQFNTKLLELEQDTTRLNRAVRRAFDRNFQVIQDSAAVWRQRADRRLALRILQATEQFIVFSEGLDQLLNLGLITEDEHESLQALSVLILGSNIRRALTRREFVRQRNAANVARLTLAAQTQRNFDLGKILENFEDAVERLLVALENALQKCHDQGETSG